MVYRELTKLKDKDVYSLILFALYKMIPIPEYSSLSELIYVLDIDNFLNVCEYFGGQTIKIPTVNEVESLIHALRLFNEVKINKKPYEQALEELKEAHIDFKNVKSQYNKLCEIVDAYTFKADRE